MIVDKESLHRLVKVLVDNGQAASFDEAEKMMGRLHLNVFVGPEVEQSLTLQAVLVTLINSGSRTFLGGISMVAPRDFVFSTPWTRSGTLKGICEELGGYIRPPQEMAPSVVLGTVDSSQVVGTIKLQATFDGWLAGLVPYGTSRLPENDYFPVAGVCAGSLALSEAFLYMWSDNAMVGRRRVIQSLWMPGTREPGPTEYWLPNKLWVVGLGHLGQAVLWSLGLLSYEDPTDVGLVLQDFDKVAASNVSTSLLTVQESVGQMKTRWTAQRCDTCGFSTTIVERKFASGLVTEADEPALCLFLTDNLEARRALEDNPFTYVIEAGLGAQASDFTQFVIHTFPGERTPHQIWAPSTPKSVAVEQLPQAYKDLEQHGMDECGLLTLAGTAVGASFVGALAASYVVSEAIRAVSRYPLYEVISGDLRDLNYLAAEQKPNDVHIPNVGVTRMQLLGQDMFSRSLSTQGINI